MQWIVLDKDKAEDLYQKGLIQLLIDCERHRDLIIGPYEYQVRSFFKNYSASEIIPIFKSRIYPVNQDEPQCYKLNAVSYGNNSHLRRVFQ